MTLFGLDYNRCYSIFLRRGSLFAGAGFGCFGAAICGWGLAALFDDGGDQDALVDHAGGFFHVLVVGAGTGWRQAGVGHECRDHILAWFGAADPVEDLLCDVGFAALHVGDDHFLAFVFFQATVIDGGRGVGLIGDGNGFFVGCFRVHGSLLKGLNSNIDRLTHRLPKL